MLGVKAEGFQTRLLMHLQSVCLDSRRQLEQWQNGPQSERNLNLSIPLLMQNKVPDGFEDGDHVKVDLRPESVSMDTNCGTGILSNLKQRCTTRNASHSVFGSEKEHF